MDARRRLPPRLRSAGLLLALLAAAGCTDLLDPLRTHEITGEFDARWEHAAAPGDSAGACRAEVRGERYRTERHPPEPGWTGTVIGRDDLAAFEVMCFFGHEYEDGYILLTVPNVRSTEPVAARTYKVIELTRGAWTRRENPGVAWSIAGVPTLRGRYLSSRSGTLEITHSDSSVVRGRFRFTATTERNP